MPTKICHTCRREFTPSSRHRNCPSCRQNAKKVLCVCGNPKQRKSVSCENCRILRDKKPVGWRGGSVKHRAGYIQRRVPDHPSGTGYVFEHRLVMEDLIGRTLLPGETVHHKNGVKDDNRPENLELWVKSQPAGQRAEDLLAWAYQIIDTYAHLYNSNNDQTS